MKTVEVQGEKIYEFSSYEDAVKYLETQNKNNQEGDKE